MVKNSKHCTIQKPLVGENYKRTFWNVSDVQKRNGQNVNDKFDLVWL